jgi:nitrite reductase/ring-hydroxylating ferredoxin subunit/uncharacterized membrane protein
MAEEAPVPTKVTHRLVAELPWLDTVAGALQKAFEPVLGQDKPRAVRDALYGTWLGHPLHPAVVDVPIGCWTSSLALDLAGEERAADLTLTLGLLGAGAAAATGAAQWQDATNLPQARRLGTLHALLNIGATALYGLSLLARKQGQRRAGFNLSLAGFAVASASAWLGGDLSYDLGIGVNRTAFEEPPTEWTNVMAETDLPAEGTPIRVMVKDVPVLLLRREGEIFAISNTCTHLGGPLHEGKVEGETVTCPWHGSVFCLRDGKLLHGPATFPAMAYEVKVEGGQVLLRANPDAPAVE